MPAFKTGVRSIVVALVASIAGDYGNVVDHTSKLVCNTLELQCAEDPSNPPVTLPLADVREIDRKLAACQQELATSALLITEVNQQIGQVDVQRFSAIVADISNNPQVSIPNDLFNPLLSRSLDALSELASDSSDLLVDIGDLQAEIENERTSIELLVQSAPAQQLDAAR